MTQSRYLWKWARFIVSEPIDLPQDYGGFKCFLSA